MYDVLIEFLLDPILIYLLDPILIFTVLLMLFFRWVRIRFFQALCVVLCIYTALWTWVPIKHHFENSYRFNHVWDENFKLDWNMFEEKHWPYIDEFWDVRSYPEFNKRLEDLDFRLENRVPIKHIVLRVTTNIIVIVGLGLLLQFLYRPKPIAKRPVKYSWSKEEKD